MDEKTSTDQAGNQWTQVDVGEVTFDQGTEWEDRFRVFLWRRIPEHPLQVVLDWESEQFSLTPDQAELLADQLPALLRAAAARARQG